MQLREIRLYGHLGREFGRVHHLAVDTVGEAIRALRANFPRFEAALLEHAPGFRIWCGTGRVGDAEDMHTPSSEREVIRLAPVVAGAGKDGLGQILLGAAIIGAAFFTGGASLTATGMFGFGTALTTTAIGSIALNIGASLILGGVAQMLAPQPDTKAGGQEGQTSPSYVFNGAQNTTVQGQPVPVGYGRLIVGSAVISAGLASEDMDTPIDFNAIAWAIADAML